ncbi:hypothetical protein PS914_06130 [Pseudomonas fluorescens]|uniref:Uncharacterized protein n=1 Tax=Pseudomonas fluorescens TaxID=294 RepID=A0A5E7V7B6_PSEFL|nr:hypothetical protein PS833_06130 [Pseudomonas fluorescens]VVQ18170.1 hypothetical protein PS914_06130 [Pseudomonas fluorescens]
MVTARLGRPVRMTSRKPTYVGSFSYKPERSALYGLRGEKRVEFVAGDFAQGQRGGDFFCRSKLARDDGVSFNTCIASKTAIASKLVLQM